MKQAVKYIALLRRLLAPLGVPAPRPESAPIAVVHRDDVEICAGPAHLGLPSAPPAKLSPEDAQRFFGITSRER